MAAAAWETLRTHFTKPSEQIAAPDCTTIKAPELGKNISPDIWLAADICKMRSAQMMG